MHDFFVCIFQGLNKERLDGTADRPSVSSSSSSGGGGGGSKHHRGGSSSFLRGGGGMALWVYSISRNRWSRVYQSAADTADRWEEEVEAAAAAKGEAPKEPRYLGYYAPKKNN